MSFSSLLFIGAFAPAALFLYYGLSRKWGNRAGLAALLGVSFLFYGAWQAWALLLLIAAILINYLIAQALIHWSEDHKPVSRKTIFILGLSLNLLFLAFYKYTDFLITNINTLFGTTWSPLNLPLPLGISFFTLQLIAFLTDCYQGIIPRVSLMNVGLFVSFFPRVINGPILAFQPFNDQLQDARRAATVDYEWISRGLFLFFIGLAKKILVADVLAEWVNNGFSSAASLTLVDGWLTAFAFTFQLYFDFSGYSDMAIGLGMLFGLRLPINFNSPLQATSIVDFWNRWHISLSQFITAYLYTPLVRWMAPLTFSKMLVAVFITMLIAGLWHGAAWTFVFFGAIHGLALVVNHISRKNKLKIPNFLGWGMTFLTVTFSFVFFRASTLTEAWHVIQALLGFHGISLPGKYLQVLPFLERLGFSFAPWAYEGVGHCLYLMPLFFLLVMAFKNSQFWVDRLEPNKRTQVILTVLIAVVLLNLKQTKSFLYVNF